MRAIMTLLTCISMVGLTGGAATAAADAPTAAATEAEAEGGSVLPQPPRVQRLANGLTVVLVPWDSPGIVAYQTTVRVGSRDEVEEGHTGFAHLFEHMMFRGTERYPKAVYERAIQLAGADNNAFTWLDLTNYFILTPSQSLPQIIEIEADRFQNLSYSEAVFRTETGAVLGEYNKNASSPGQLMEEALLETAFMEHTYSHSTMGYLADIEKMPGYFDYSRAFFRRYYTPDNCWVVVVGDFDPDATLRRIVEHYGGWEGRRDRPAIPVEPPQTEPRSRHLDWPTPTAPRMTLAYRIPAFSLEDTTSATFDVVRELVFGPSSPLYRRLVIEEKKALSLSAPSGIFSPFTRDPFLLTVDVTLKPGVAFEEIEAAVTSELAALARGEIDADRVEDVRSHIRYAYLTGLETPEDVAMAYAMVIAATGDPAGVEGYPQRVAAVTADDVRRVASRYLVPEKRTIVTLAHAPSDDTAEAGAGAAEGGTR